MDHNSPVTLDLQRLSDTVSEIAWRYVTTHSAEECEALIRRAEEKRLIRQRAFYPRPVPSVSGGDYPNGPQPASGETDYRLCPGDLEPDHRDQDARATGRTQPQG